MKKILFSTGEFAALCGITKDTLFHYERIGIFSPYYVNEQGYRFYNILQYEDIAMILDLRALGKSLNEIKEYLKDRNTDKYLAELSKEVQNLEKKIREFTDLKEIVSYAIDDLRNAHRRGEDIYIEKKDEELITISKEMVNADEYEMEYVISELIRGIKVNTFQRALGMIHYKDDILSGEYNGRTQFYFKYVKGYGEGVKKEAGEYLCAHHIGEYSELYRTYGRMLKYAEERGIEIGDEIYEETITDSLAEKDMSKIITKVEMRIIGKTDKATVEK